MAEKMKGVEHNWNGRALIINKVFILPSHAY